MSRWPAVKASRVLVALLRLGWQMQSQSGSRRTLRREGWPDSVFAFHDSEEIGPRMLARIAKHTGLRPEDLWDISLHRPSSRSPGRVGRARPASRLVNRAAPLGSGSVGCP